MIKSKLFISLKRIVIDLPFVKLEVNNGENYIVNLNEIKKIYIKKNKPSKLHSLVIMSLIICCSILWQYSFSSIERFLIIILLSVVNLFFLLNNKKYTLYVILNNGSVIQIFIPKVIKYETIKQLQIIKKILGNEIYPESKRKIENEKIMPYSFI